MIDLDYKKILKRSPFMATGYKGDNACISIGNSIIEPMNDALEIPQKVIDLAIKACKLFPASTMDLRRGDKAITYDVSHGYIYAANDYTIGRLEIEDHQMPDGIDQPCAVRILRPALAILNHLYKQNVSAKLFVRPYRNGSNDPMPYNIIKLADQSIFIAQRIMPIGINLFEDHLYFIRDLSYYDGFVDYAKGDYIFKHDDPAGCMGTIIKDREHASEAKERFEKAYPNVDRRVYFLHKVVKPLLKFNRTIVTAGGKALFAVVDKSIKLKAIGLPIHV